jgi:1-acyl-sn-glycerol-3-phosphate acyltransferase
MQLREETELTLQAARSRRQAPRPTLIARLLFLWFWIVTITVMIPMSIVQLVSHRFQPTAVNFKRNASLWGWSILRVGAGIRVAVSERAPLDPSQPYVFVCNHQNSLDILALAAALPYPFGFLAKIELNKVPFLGLAMRNSATVFIDRSDPRASVESLRQAGERIRAGTSVLVFSEGARSHGPQLQPLKKGAFMVAVEAGVPVVPVTILDAHRLLDEKRMVIRPGTLHMVVGTPISMAGRHRRDIPAVMAEVEAQMQAALE